MQARDVMTPNPEVLTPDEPVSRAAQLMRDIDVGIIPVVDDRTSMRPVGVITDRDIAVRHVADLHGEQCRVGDHMTRDRLDAVRPDTDVHEVLECMKREQVRRVLVVDEGDRLVGIIAQADIARKEGPEHPEHVEEVLERISEPGRPRR